MKEYDRSWLQPLDEEIERVKAETMELRAEKERLRAEAEQIRQESEQIWIDRERLKKVLALRQAELAARRVEEW